MHIGARDIGPASPPYVIAEIGVNHDGDPDRALRLVDHAADAGADAVKLQHFEAARLLSRAARLAAYQKAAGERDPVDMLARLELPLDAMAGVVNHAHARGLHAIVTVFSVELVRDAATLPWDAYKTASPDLVNRPLLEALRRTGRPLIVSTGAATAEEVERALGWLDVARDRLALLQCVSCYPTPTELASIGGVVALRRLHDGPIGYSDHTPDEDTGELAVRLHASLLEKHLTHDRAAPGPDHAASLEPEQLGRYVARCRRAWVERSSLADPLSDHQCRRIGTLDKRVLPIEADVRATSRQSLTTTRPLEAGETLRREDLTVKRPGTGIEPWQLDRAIGRTIARHVDADTPLRWDDLAGHDGLALDASAA